MSWLLAALLSTIVGAPAPDCIIVEFTVDNCGPCRQMQPALDKLKNEGWDIRTVNAEREPALVRKHAIDSVPTLVFISNGKEVDRIVGAAPYEKILPRLAKLLLSTTNSQTDASQIMPSAPAQFSHAAPAVEVDKRRSLQPSQLNEPQPGITVRGQSPIGAFPMLAAAAGSALATSPSSQAIADKFERLGSPIDQLASNTMPVNDAVQSHTPSGQPERIPTQPTHQLATKKNTAPIDLQKAIARAESATVRIRVDEENTTAYGTGTVIDVHGDEALVLTCGHLFREMKPHSQLTIDLFAGRSQPMNIPAQLIDFKADAGDVDIGLISFKLPFAIEPVPLLPQTETLAVNQRAFSFGCDHGENPTRRDTQVKSINRYMGGPNIEIAGAPAVGRSGGGLFDHQGRLIGVCNAADAASDEGIYAAAGIVYAQIDRLGLSHLFNDNAPIQSAPVQFAGNQTTVLPIAEPNLSASPRPVAGTATPQLTCIVRDSSGREQVVRVESPSPELLDAIQRQANISSNK